MSSGLTKGWGAFVDWWRVAVAYELIGRVGWRSEHHTEIDPLSWLPACAEFLDEPVIQ